MRTTSERRLPMSAVLGWATVAIIAAGVTALIVWLSLVSWGQRPWLIATELIVPSLLGLGTLAVAVASTLIAARSARASERATALAERSTELAEQSMRVSEERAEEERASKARDDREAMARLFFSWLDEAVVKYPNSPRASFSKGFADVEPLLTEISIRFEPQLLDLITATETALVESIGPESVGDAHRDERFAHAKSVRRAARGAAGRWVSRGEEHDASADFHSTLETLERFRGFIN